jgi:hypothetical protein
MYQNPETDPCCGEVAAAQSTAPSSGRPKVASALPNAAIEASSDMSTGMIVCFPVPSRRAERASRRSTFLAAKTRVCPANARRSHSGAPMPPVAPVTRIVFCMLIAPPLSAAISSSEALYASREGIRPEFLPEDRTWKGASGECQVYWFHPGWPTRGGNHAHFRAVAVAGAGPTGSTAHIGAWPCCRDQPRRFRPSIGL